MEDIKLEHVIQSGVKAETLLFYKEYTDIFHDFREMGKGYDEALFLTANKCCVSIRTVEKAVGIINKLDLPKMLPEEK